MFCGMVLQLYILTRWLGESHFFPSSPAWGIPYLSDLNLVLICARMLVRTLVLSGGVSQSISSPVNYLFSDFAFFWCISCAFPIPNILDQSSPNFSCQR